MEKVLESIHAIVWGIPILILILYVGIHLSLQSGFAQIRLLPFALRKFCQSFRNSGHSKPTISGYKALCTAMAATVGTGNIAGVAGAIAIGGPGVILWMWICAVLGMITKFAEVTLALQFRVQNTNREFLGGPMYTIARGLPDRFRVLAYLYCFFGIVAAFGVGNATQVNAVSEGIKDIASAFNYQLKQSDLIVIGVIIALLIMFAFRGGSAGIGNWAEKLVPLASVAYILLAVGVLFTCFDKIPYAIGTIVTSAFTPKAMTGGVIGSVFITMRIGVSRGVFTNEAGMGTAAIAHASANTEEPVEQGLMGIMEVFLDTILLCTLTALVILSSGVPIPYGTDPGITLTMDAFSAVYGEWVKLLLTGLVCIFAFATILGWGLYGARCMQYLFGSRSWNIFVIAQCVCIVVSTTLKTSVIWIFAEIVNGLMALPNLVSVILLSPMFIKCLKKYVGENKKAYRLK